MFRHVAPILANSLGVVASALAPVKVYVRLLQPGLRIWVISTRIRNPIYIVSGSGDEEAEDRLVMSPDCPCQQQWLLEQIHKPGLHGSRSDDGGSGEPSIPLSVAIIE